MQWKQEIQTQLQQGKSPQQVIDYFQTRFGPAVLQEPPKGGALLVVWVLPWIGLIALAVGAVIVLWRISAPKLAPSGNTEPQLANMADNEYAARLEEEVRESAR